MNKITPNMLVCLLSLAMLLPAIVVAGSINGFVRDAETGEGIPYANVYLKNTSLGTVTNQDEYFILSDVPAGRDTLVASFIGYKLFKQPIALVDSTRRRVDIELQMRPISGFAIE